jgi:glucan biosynthesis protein C
MTLSATIASNRRYDLDWLRILAFGLLITYHLGMFYVTWGWHVKSVHAASTIEPFMLAVSPWRLALLFFVSGVAVRFAMDKSAPARFVASRMLRLGLPVLVGMGLTVAPQTYWQVRQAGLFEGDIVGFYTAYLSGDHGWGIVTPTWNHLWYLVYLLTYIVILWPLIGIIRRGQGAVDRLFRSKWAVAVVIPLPFAAYECLLSPAFPTTHALWGDWAHHAHRLTTFMLGVAVAKSAPFWDTIKRLWLPALFFAGIVGPVWILGIAHDDGLQPSLAPLLNRIWPAVGISFAWATIFALLGLAQALLTGSGPILRYLTGAVFCYYVLHQTIIITVGAPLTGMGLDPVLEAAVIAIATVVGCATGYEILRRIPYLRIAFGIRN